jgi:hypothetical protein
VHGAGHGSAHAAGHGHNAIHHDARVNSFAIVREGEIIPRRLARWIKMIGKLPKERGRSRIQLHRGISARKRGNSASACLGQWHRGG